MHPQATMTVSWIRASSEHFNKTSQIQWALLHSTATQIDNSIYKKEQYFNDINSTHIVYDFATSDVNMKNKIDFYELICKW